MALRTEEGEADLMEEEKLKHREASAKLTQEGSSAAYQAEKAAFGGESSAFTAKIREGGGGELVQIHIFGEAFRKLKCFCSCLCLMRSKSNEGSRTCNKNSFFLPHH